MKIGEKPEVDRMVAFQILAIVQDHALQMKTDRALVALTYPEIARRLNGTKVSAMHDCGKFSVTGNSSYGLRIVDGLVAEGLLSNEQKKPSRKALFTRKQWRHSYQIAEKGEEALARGIGKFRISFTSLGDGSSLGPEASLITR